MTLHGLQGTDRGHQSRNAPADDNHNELHDGGGCIYPQRALITVRVVAAGH